MSKPGKQLNRLWKALIEEQTSNYILTRMRALRREVSTNTHTHLKGDGLARVAEERGLRRKVGSAQGEEPEHGHHVHCRVKVYMCVCGWVGGWVGGWVC